MAYEWAQAGGISDMQPAGMWWAAIPKQRWHQPDGERPDQKPGWDPRYGDRTQELVFIGQNMDEAGIRAKLNACLLDAKLAAADSRAWLNLPNPFPEFDMNA